MKIKRSSIYMLLVFIVSGFLFSYIFSKPAATKIPWENITTTKTIYEYQTEINNLKLNDQELQDKIISYNEKLTSYSKENPDLETVTNELYNEQTKYDIITGKADVKGEGIRIELSDSDKILGPDDNISNYIIHNVDVLEIINQLKASGAEVIAINGYRLNWNSKIDCAGPVIYIDDFIAGNPFVLEAIGDKEELYAGMEAEDSIVQVLRYWEINIKINEIDEIIIKGR